MLKPLFERVLIDPIKETETKSGLIIPKDNDDRKPLTAKVIAVSDGALDKQTDVKVGDTVLVTRFVGHNVKTDEGDYIMVSFDDILAIID